MSPARKPRPEPAIRIALGFHEALGRQDLASMMQLIGAECIMEANGPAPDGATYRGKRAVEAYWSRFLAESRDFQHQIEDIFSRGTRCVLRSRAEWKDSHGMPRAIRRVDIFEVKEGRVTGIQSYVKG